jgi:hypothetical protein
VLAASVVDTFRPEALVPVPGREQDLGNLLNQSVATERDDGTLEWRLRNDVRRSALQVLSQRQLLQATLDENRGAGNADSPYQVLFEQYLAGNPAPLEEQDLDQLQASLNAVQLLEGLVPDLPDVGIVREALYRRGFIHQFELLADDHFVGRSNELRKLRDFVDVAPTSLFHRVRRGSSLVLGGIGFHRIFLHEPPMLVTGMGGIGKSSLLSRFLLEHARLKDADLLFAYIDFDKAAIWPDQPLTVLVEIAQQLALQEPLHARRFRELAKDLSAQLSVATSFGGDFDSFEALADDGTHAYFIEKDAIKQFSEICERAFKRPALRTLLLVLDTFEEVSQRSPRHLQHLLNFIGELQSVMPRLRVVISGRGMHSDESAWHSAGLINELAKAMRPLEIGELSESDACALLRSLGAPNLRTNKAIFRHTGGHPLSLRLAAQLVRAMAQEQGRDASEITSAELITDEWRDGMSEGFLYGRIISHLPDGALQSLADPGFVLREITPGVLLDVLNKPCGLGLSNLEEAEALFDRLAQFNQLVSFQSAGVLRHRSELRDRVLTDMWRRRRKLCRQIWSSAVEYYEQGKEGSAEAMYCRLMLDQPTELLVEKWRTGMEKALLRSRREMPTRARQFLDLMALMADGQSSLDERLDRNSDLDQALLAEEMKLLLSKGEAQEALNLFRATSSEKAPRYDSRLYSIYLRAAAQSGDLTGAVSAAWRTMDRLEVADRVDGGAYHELLLLCCQITQAQHARRSPGTSRKDGFLLQANDLWHRFDTAFLKTDRPVQVLRTAIALLSVFDLEGSASSDVGLFNEKSARLCAERALDAMERLRPDYARVDGPLLVRALAWLSAHGGTEAGLLELLMVPQATEVLIRDYGNSLEAYLANAGDFRLMAKLRSSSEAQLAGRSRSIGMTPEEFNSLCLALRQLVRARDNTQYAKSL